MTTELQVLFWICIIAFLLTPSEKMAKTTESRSNIHVAKFIAGAFLVLGLLVLAFEWIAGNSTGGMSPSDCYENTVTGEFVCTDQ